MLSGPHVKASGPSFGQSMHDIEPQATFLSPCFGRHSSPSKFLVWLGAAAGLSYVLRAIDFRDILLHGPLGIKQIMQRPDTVRPELLWRVKMDAVCGAARSVVNFNGGMDFYVSASSG
jgi:hypothetical protein